MGPSELDNRQNPRKDKKLRKFGAKRRNLEGGASDVAESDGLPVEEVRCSRATHLPRKLPADLLKPFVGGRSYCRTIRPPCRCVTIACLGEPDSQLGLTVLGPAKLQGKYELSPTLVLPASPSPHRRPRIYQLCWNFLCINSKKKYHRMEKTGRSIRTKLL